MNERDVIEACARAAHEANRAYCLAIGDVSQTSWDDAPEWQRSSARNGVADALVGATGHGSGTTGALAAMRISWPMASREKGELGEPIR